MWRPLTPRPGLFWARIRTFVLVCSAAVVAALSCNRRAGDAPGTAGGSSEDDCKKYERVFCAKLIPDSEDCKAMKQISKFFPPAACAAGLGDLTYTEIKVAEERKPCTELVDRLCKDVGTDSGCVKARERTPGFTAKRCASMLERYAEVLAELKKEEPTKKPASVNDE
jgi:hypothetical protein